MRFSSVFQPPAVSPQPAAVPAQRARAEAAPEAAVAPMAAQPLPEELDARVRLIGEWQLGEAD